MSRVMLRLLQHRDAEFPSPDEPGSPARFGKVAFTVPA